MVKTARHVWRAAHAPILEEAHPSTTPLLRSSPSRDWRNWTRNLLKRHESKAKILLIQGGPGTNLGTSSSAGLLVIGGVTYSSSSSSNSKGPAAEPIPRTQGLLSSHLHKRSAIESTLASKITLSARTSSSSRESWTTTSLLAPNSWR